MKRLAREGLSLEPRQAALLATDAAAASHILRLDTRVQARRKPLHVSMTSLVYAPRTHTRLRQSFRICRWFIDFHIRKPARPDCMRMSSVSMHAALRGNDRTVDHPGLSRGEEQSDVGDILWLSLTERIAAHGVGVDGGGLRSCLFAWHLLVA